MRNLRIATGLAGTTLLLGLWGIYALGAGADDQRAPRGLDRSEQAGKPLKKVAFEMRDKPWSAVLEWLADQTGTPVITNHKPTGTFTFISPQKGGMFTIPEVIDILNEALLNQKYLLIRRVSSFTIVPADEKIDPAIVPRVYPEDLEGRGNTELVSVVLPLTSLVAEDAATEVKKMMGPFGEVVPLSRANQLLLQDTVGNLKRIRKTLQDIEDTEKNQGESYSHPCRYIKARDAEKTLKELLGDPREAARAQAQILAMQQGFGGGRFQMPPPQPAAPAAGAPGSRQRMHSIAADERTNTLIVRGPADIISQAKEILRKIDVPQKDQPPVLVGPAGFKTYTVPGGNAEAVARTLQEVYKASSSVRISAVGNGSILVYAGPEEQFEIARHISGAREQDGGPVVISLTALEASKAVDTLKGMFGGGDKVGGPYLEADASRNAVIVKGSADQISEVRAALKALGEGGAGSGTMRVITLDKGSAATLAEALQRLLPQLRQNPVNVIVPGAEPPAPRPSLDKQGGNKPTSQDGAETLIVPVSAPLADPQAPQPAPGAAGNKGGSPVNVMAFGNRLVISSDDPQALALAQELVRLLTQTPAGEGDFEVIKLKNANATEAARVLDEAFNGPKQNNQPQQGFPGGGGGGFFGRFAAQNARTPTTPQVNRIRVVADTSSNTLLVRASPLDLMTIRRLLDRAIDNDKQDSKAVVKNWIIPLQHASAAEVANTVREAYREYMNGDAISATVGGFRGFGFARLAQSMNNVDANGNPRQVTLSVGVDDRSNRLVLVCSERMYDDIKKLVTQLDDAAKDSNRTVRVLSIKGIDPNLVQEAIDAIQGRRPATTGTMGRPGGGSQGGFQRQGGGGQGGFGGQRGNGMGGGPPGNPRPPGQQSRGPDFFGPRVTDDPQLTVLYDPNPPVEEVQQAATESSDGSTVQLVRFETQQPGAQAAAQPSISGPRAPVNVQALEQLGVVVISGNNPADVEEVVRIIEYLQKLGAGAEIEIQLVPLQQADATSIANTLTQLYQRVVVGPAGNLRGPATTGSTTIQTPGGAQLTTSAQQNASVVILPLPRFNAVLVAAPKARLADVLRDIKQLDRPSLPQGRALPFPLKKASASRVASLITSFYAQRYPSEAATQNQVRVTFDDTTNTVFVQAGPADLEEIRDLIGRIDTTVSSAVNDVRIVSLRNALAEEIANLLLQAIAHGIGTATPAPTTPVVPTTPAGLPGAPRPPGAAAAPILPTAAAPVASATPGGTSVTKATTLRFLSTRPDVRAGVESGILDDIHVTPDARTNSLILSAPARSMDLLLALLRDLDVPPQARAEVKVFNLQRADAAAMAAVLQQLFLGAAATTPGGVGGGLPGVPGGGGLPGGLGGGGGLGGTGLGTVAPIAGPAVSGAAGIPRAQFSLSGITPEGAPIVPLSVTVDARTNSIIVAGSRNDLNVIEAIISRLEDTTIEGRHNQVYRLRNASAADVATALQNFLTRSLQVLQLGQQLTAFQEIQRDVVVVAEPITNTLLVSATARYFPDVMRLIQDLDAQPPQVVIQVLVADLDLTTTEEFGAEIGLQSPVLFTRSIVPSTSFLGPNGNVTFTNAAGGLVPPGVTVNNSINPAAQPGFNFNNVSLPLGNNPVQNPGVVGFQGLGNLGVGRADASGLGGFVFSAASDTFSLLIRALKTQGRLEVLSRPQIQTTDGQTALINIGQLIPYVTTSNITGTGIISNSIEYRPVGVILQVTPRISPDGTVLMRVIPEVSKVSPTQISLGNGQTATAFDTQHVETTILAEDGETVAIAGLISKTNVKNENKIPWFGDLPYVGALFRYRTQVQDKRELMVILTPHIVRSRMDADQILYEESRRMDWCLGDVAAVHGTSGMAPLLDPKWPGARSHDGPPPPPLPPGSLPSAPPGATVLPDSVPHETLPTPQVVPPVQTRGMNPEAASPAPADPSAPGAGPALPTPQEPANRLLLVPQEFPQNPPKEERKWNPFRGGQ